MIKVSVLYPNKPATPFDFDYHLAYHIPLGGELLQPTLRMAEAKPN